MDYACKLEVVHKYNKLKKFSKKENVEDWLSQWEVVYTKGEKLNLPNVMDERPLLDFTHAISTINSSYTSI
jgi:hypothetical protein